MLLKPQNGGTLPGDKVIYLDPGRNNCFTAMQDISTPWMPAPILNLSAGEYKVMAGIKLMNRARHRLKRINFNDPAIPLAQKIQQIESVMPSSKTSRSARVLVHIQYVHDNCTLLTNFYDQRYSKFRFWGYVGRQKALSEVHLSFFLYYLHNLQ